MIVLAIDPGPEESAFVRWNGRCVLDFGKMPNTWIVNELRHEQILFDTCVIEQIASYGMAVGAEVFETCVWTGRFMEAVTLATIHECERVKRIEVKNHLCHSSRANDANIRQAIIDRFGGKDRAIGRKKSPGPLYGVSGDAWAALAVGLTWWDKNVKASEVA